MTTQNYFILSEAQASTATGYNNMVAGVAVDPRQIDSLTPGSGINTNQDATGFNVGDAVTLLAQYTVPVRVVNDPEHLTHTPDMVTFLLTLPTCLLENETFYLPSI